MFETMVVSGALAVATAQRGLFGVVTTVGFLIGLAPLSSGESRSVPNSL